MVPLVVELTAHDGTPPRGCALELYAGDSRTSLARCDIEDTSRCDLSTNHRGVAFLELYSALGTHSVGLVLTDEPTSIEITLDPPGLTQGTTFAFDPETSVTARTARISLDLAHATQQRILALKNDAELGPDARATDASEDQEALARRLLDAFETSDVPEVKAVALVAALSSEGLEGRRRAELADLALADLRPNDPIWGLYQGAITSALKYATSPADAYGDTVIREHANPSVSSSILLSRLRAADEAGEDERARVLLEKLGAPRFEGTFAQTAAPSFDPNRPIRAGRPLPPVLASTLARPGAPAVVVDWTQRMKGQVYVLEFWAKWCTGCMVAMPQVHRLYEDFHPRGLEIVSVSVQSREVLDEVRETWPMPWTHALLANSASAFYDVFGPRLPRVLLVDQDGVIRAVDVPWTAIREELDEMLPG